MGTQLVSGKYQSYLLITLIKINSNLLWSDVSPRVVVVHSSSVSWISASILAFSQYWLTIVSHFLLK